MFNNKIKKVNKRLHEIIRENNGEITYLRSELQRLKEEEEKRNSEYCINLREINSIKKLQWNLKKSNLYEKCEYFNDNYKINSTSNSVIDTTNFKEFETKKDIDRWSTSLYGLWADNLKSFKSDFGIYKPYPFDKYSNLNSKHTSLEMYCGNAYIKMNKILRKIYDDNPKLILYNEQLCNVLVLELLSAPRIDVDIVLYRIVDSVTFELIMKHISEYTYFRELGFVSTTLLKKMSITAKLNLIPIQNMY